MSRPQRQAEYAVLFDAPGPRAKKFIAIGNIVGGAIIAAVIFVVALKLQERGQLTARKWGLVVEARSWTAYILPGIGNTLLAAAVSILGAFAFGLVFGVGRLAHFTPIRWLSNIIVEFFRAVPVLLMMIFLWSFLGALSVPNPSFLAVVIALILYNGSVCADLIRSGVHNLPTGQHEAAMAIGLTRGQALAQVLVPQALLSMLPALIAQLVVALKDSALGSAIAYSELLRQATLLGTPFNTLQTLVVASAIFIAINYGLGKLGEWLARKMRGRGLKLDDDMAEVMPMNVPSSSVQVMIESPDDDGRYDESARQRQAQTGQRRHL